MNPTEETTCFIIKQSPRVREYFNVRVGTFTLKGCFIFNAYGFTFMTLQLLTN